MNIHLDTCNCKYYLRSYSETVTNDSNWDPTQKPTKPKSLGITLLNNISHMPGSWNVFLNIYIWERRYLLGNKSYLFIQLVFSFTV